VARARRLDRSARLGAVAVQRALAEAHAPVPGTGVVLGSAYGNVDASAAFMHRIFDRGPRSASPAEFPNLVPSSPVGHVSIYLGLRGPAFATADLAASGESAFVQAVQLVATGQAQRIVAGAVEPKSDIVDRVLAALFAHSLSQATGKRGDVAAALIVENERVARERGAPVLARVRQVLEWRSGSHMFRPHSGTSSTPPRERGGGGDVPSPLASLRPPSGGRAECGLARPNGGVDALLAGTPWAACPRFACDGAVGESDGLGAVVLAAAVGRIATGRAREVLVVGLAKERGYAIVLAAP